MRSSAVTLLQWPAEIVPIAEAVPLLSVHTAPRFCAAGPKKPPSMRPVAEAGKLDGVPGAEVTAVLPVKRLVPVVMLAEIETLFHWVGRTGGE